jgi:NAD(P)-dependent dehydrogenase (short-subunit alcohol dehydrogenase family)
MDLQLKGLKAIVTGGTKGIGLAIARTLAAEGADVAICARDEAAVEATASVLAELSGARASGAAIDVSDGDALKAWVARVGAQWGGLDIIVANVSALAIGNDIGSWRKEFETDLLGTVNLVDAAIAAGPYGVFKAALVHYMQGLANQLASKGIRANTVSPGNVYFEGGVWDWIEHNDAALFERALALNPTGRMGRPQEIANAVAFIASPAASFVSGANFVVDGALTRGVQL